METRHSQEGRPGAPAVQHVPRAVERVPARGAAGRGGAAAAGRGPELQPHRQLTGRRLGVDTDAKNVNI